MTNSTGIELNWPGRKKQIELTAVPQSGLPRLFFPVCGNAGRSNVTQPAANLLLQGDNAPGLRHLLATVRGEVQLIYLDPPFATGRKFHQPAGQKNKHTTGTIAYHDNWQHSRGTYLNLLEERLRLSHELLSRSGSLYLHLDYRMAPIARLLLDEIFGANCFVNEIIWYYRTGGMPEKLGFGRKHDTLLFYVRDPDQARWHRQQEKSYLSHKYGFSNIELHEDEQGIYTMANMRDVWDIPALRGNQPERVAYPTQKPLELLSRIILASSDPGDLILDPFAGSGTTLVAAEKLERRWIGLDNSPLAISVIQDRMAGLQQHNAYELQSLTQVAHMQYPQETRVKQERQFQENVLGCYAAEPVSDKLYHAHRDESALFVDNLRKALTAGTLRKLLEECGQDGFQRLLLLTAGRETAQLDSWRREAERQDIRFTIKQIPGELTRGEKTNRNRLTFDEIPGLVWRGRTRKGERYLELIELQFNDPSPRQQELLEKTGWRGLVSSWWVRDRHGTVLWQSGALKVQSGNEPLFSGQLPSGKKLKLEVRNLQGIVW